ncbi:hypothetical protein T07_7591 [Trichinella nelsoni]|uniref:Uncharacterized protein n=1 Tax=Trichinella nelsoni TaxID=6336 RepID=A0A0V0S410_9BILA|nr:hypothetical protein T07_7591 [Trichinella nelsoni]
MHIPKRQSFIGHPLLPIDCWHQFTGHKGMDGEKLLIPLRYNFECTIRAPCFGLPQQSNVVTGRKHHNVPRCTLS